MMAVLALLFAVGIWASFNVTVEADEAPSVSYLTVGETAIVEEGQIITEDLPEGITYDVDSNLLTLNNVSIPSSEDGGGVSYNGSKDLTIKIEGTVTLKDGNSISYYGNDEESTSGASINVIGDGQDSSTLIQEGSNGDKFILFSINGHESFEVLEPTKISNVLIDGLTIQSSGGIDSDYANFTISNCSWTMDGADAPIRLRINGSAGILNVSDSVIKMKAFKKTSEFPYAIKCRELVLNGLNLYAGSYLTRLTTKLEVDGVKTWNGYKAYLISDTAQLWCKLTFNGNGGKAAKSYMWVKKGTAPGTLPNATKTHYKKTGWYTKKTGGTKVKATTKISTSKTLYAHWAVAGKKTTTKLISKIKANGTTYRIYYNTNGMVKKITGGGDKREFTYDDQLRYKTVKLYQSHYKSGKKPMFIVTFDYATKKAKWVNRYYGDTWTVKFKTNSKGNFTSFVVDTGEKHTFSYNSKGYMTKEVERESGKVMETKTYGRSSSGLIKSVSVKSKWEGNYKASFKYKMKNGVPLKYTGKVSSYTDKAYFSKAKKTVRVWQKKMIKKQQKMLYLLYYRWGDPIFVFI